MYVAVDLYYYLYYINAFVFNSKCKFTTYYFRYLCYFAIHFLLVMYMKKTSNLFFNVKKTINYKIFCLNHFLVCFLNKLHVIFLF